MARDYSSRRNNPPGGHKRKTTKGAAAARPMRQKKNAPRQKPGNSGGQRNNISTLRSGAPGCIWLLCGLFLGIAGLSVYYIASRPAGHGPETMRIDLPDNESAGSGGADDQSPSSERSSGQQQGTTATEKTKPQFSFYKMLPNYKVEVPAGQQAPQPVTDGHAPHEAEPTAHTPAPGSSRKASDSNADHPSSHSQPATDNDTGAGYIIQAGAFSTEDDADHRKARLALLGITAQIVDIRTSSGKTVYRVQSDTLASRDKARSLTQRLKSHGIETMVRRAQ